jgi:hypothetical protein
MQRHVPLALVLGFALALRLLHLGWGLPEVYEEATPYRKAWAFWNWGNPGIDLNPRFFNYPALTFYMHFAVQAAHYGTGRAAGAFTDPEAFHASCEQNPTTGILLARAANVLMDLGTVLFVFVLAKRLAGGQAALLAGLLVAVAPLHIQQAQMVNVDIPLSMLVMATLYLVVRLQEEGTTRWYLWSGAAIGLAASAKYTGALLCLPLLAAVAAREGRATFRRAVFVRLVGAALVAGGLFLILNPFILLDPRRFLADFGFERTHMETGHFGILPGSSTIGYYFLQAVPAGFGLLPAVFAVMGAGSTRNAQWPARLAIAIWPLVYLLIIFGWTMRADRYLLPVTPVLAIWSAFGILWLWNLVVPAGPRRSVVLASAAVLGIALLGEPVVADMRYYRTATLPDTRDVAREWIERTLPPGSVAAMGPLGLILKPPLVTFPLPYRSVKFEELAPFYDARWYADFDLAVGSNFDRARFLLEPDRFGDFLRYYYDSLEVRWSTAVHLEPVRGQRGPAIWLYTPPRPAPALYDTALFGRLRRVSSVGMLRAFAGNLLAIQTARRNMPKVVQLLDWQTGEYLRRGLRDDAAEAVRRLLEIHPGEPHLVALRDSLAHR